MSRQFSEYEMATTLQENANQSYIDSSPNPSQNDSHLT